MKILRITTAGSVDDGKSTLIGRLLYDTKSLPSDKVENIKKLSEQKGLDDLDLSLITDGLTAEREQGITIDVAHIYFNTPKRKYIIADSPGHVEYTRNMVTGASNSDVFVILIDARNGIIEQTKRHLFIANLIGIQEVLFVVNKMDLVDYSEEVYNSIVADLKQLTEKYEMTDRSLSFFPVSAKIGDNVLNVSQNTPWYEGPSLLDKLESIEITEQDEEKVRFDVQYVIRPHSDEFHDFRGYAGKLKSGALKVGDEISVAQSGLTSRIKSIRKYKTELNSCKEGDSVVLELEDDIDVSRGDLLTNKLIEGKRAISSTICWLSKDELNPSTRYLLKHGTGQTAVKFSQVKATLDIEALDFSESELAVNVNSIAQVDLRSASPLFIESYRQNKANGYFIIVDEVSNGTVAVGFSAS